MHFTNPELNKSQKSRQESLLAQFKLFAVYRLAPTAVVYLLENKIKMKNAAYFN